MLNLMDDEVEGDLDVQSILAMGQVQSLCSAHFSSLFLSLTRTISLSQNVPTWFWDSADGLWILQWAFEVGVTSNPPLVHSLSYGTSILSQCAIAQAWCSALGYNSSAYVDRTNLELQKLVRRRRCSLSQA